MPTRNGGSPKASVANGNGGGFSPQTKVKVGSESIPVNWESLARATAHPLRISILEILGIDGGRVLSPNDLSHELQIPLSNTNYHVTELAKANLIELVRERPVRGATEHFYRLPGGDAEIDPEESGGVGSAEAELHAAAIG